MCTCLSCAKKAPLPPTRQQKIKEKRMTDYFVPWHLQNCLCRLPTRFWKRACLCAGLYVFILTCRTWQRSEVQSMFSQGWYIPRVTQFSRITMILMRSNHVRKHMLRLMFFSRHVNAIIHKKILFHFLKKKVLTCGKIYTKMQCTVLLKSLEHIKLLKSDK